MTPMIPRQVKLKQLLIAGPAALLVFGSPPTNAGALNDTGTMAGVTDKWDEKEPEKGHKLVDAAMRCVLVPDDPAEKAITQDCVGNYEYMPDGSWKGEGPAPTTTPMARLVLVGRRVPTLRNTRTRKPVALEIRVNRRAAVPTCMKI